MMATVFDGLDGKVYLDEQGLTFERTKFRAAGRGVGLVHAVPWSAIRSAEVTDRSLRVAVAGFTAPQQSVADPHSCDLRRGQGDLAVSFAELVNARAAGPDAVAALTTAVAPAATPMTASKVTPPNATDRPHWTERLLGFSVIASSVAVLIWALAILAAVVCFAIVLFIVAIG